MRIPIIIILCFALSCAKSKEICTCCKIPCGIASPYGWINYEEKNPNVAYRICIPNIFWSIILAETIFMPILLTGYELYEPVKAK